MDINVSTVINSLSYGICGFNILKALDELGHNPAFFSIAPIEAPHEHHQKIQKWLDNSVFYNSKAPSLRIWHQFQLAQHIGEPKCAFPIFELNHFNKVELHHLKQQDHIIVPSRWAASVIETNDIGVSVSVAPFGVDREIFRPPPLPVKGGPTVFLNIGKWELRKGHDVLIDAFCKAFTKDDDVRLIMAPSVICLPQDKAKAYHEDWVRLYSQSDLTDKIGIVDRLPSQHEVAQLMSQVDCGVFPSRAEGFNLPLAEMLSMGKHCIATNYSAHTEFCNSNNCALIDIDRLETANDGIWFNPYTPVWEGLQPGQWARLGSNQIDQLVAYMRSIHKKKQEDGSVGINEAGIVSMEPFTWVNTAKSIVKALAGE